MGIECTHFISITAFHWIHDLSIGVIGREVQRNLDRTIEFTSVTKLIHLYEGKGNEVKVYWYQNKIIGA